MKSKFGFGMVLVTGFFVILFVFGIVKSTVMAEPTAEFTVNSTSDAVDINPGDGSCSTNSGVCTLRAAIQETNALAGEDTITLPAGTYILALTGSNEDNAASGDLDITDSLILNGAAANATIIDANEIDRIFHVFSATTISNITMQNGLGFDPSFFECGGGGIRHNSGELTISNSIITNNSTTQNGGGICDFSLSDITLINSVVDGNSAGFHSGGIHIDLPSNLNLIDSTLSNNTAWDGGAITFRANDASHTLNVDNSHIISNTADNNGGGIYVTGGILSLNKGELSQNSADSWGGGMYLSDEVYIASIDNVAIANNTSQWGGAFFIDSDNTEIKITDAMFTHNMASAGGGAIYYGDTENTSVRISGSTFSGNYLPDTATSGGGAVLIGGENKSLTVFDSRFERNTSPVYGGGGIANFADHMTITISNTEFISNTSTNGGGLVLYGNHGNGTIHNSVFDNNSATYMGGAISQGEFTLTVTQSSLTNNSGLYGGGLHYTSGSMEDDAGSYLTTINTTFSGNQATESGGGVSGMGTLTGWTVNNTTFAFNIADADNNGSGNGGGFALENGAFNHIANSIIAKNVDMGGEVPDCISQGIVSSGFNLIGISDGCNWNADSSDIVGTLSSSVDPLLGPLTGSPAYHSLKTNSPALDAGGSAVEGGVPNCALVDQIGTPRPIDGNGDGTAICDIGAIEVPIQVFLPMILR